MENAQSILIDTSMERPVLIDFWADWCEPCKTMTPVLESIAADYAGKFLLAKVNADEMGAIAGQLGVRSLPTLILMQGGQPVDGLVGAQSEQAVRAMLDKYVLPAWKEDWEQAKALMAGGEKDQYAQALALMKGAWAQAQDPLLAVDYAVALIETGQLDQAEALLNDVKLEDRHAAWNSAQAKLELKREAGMSPAIVALQEALAADPENLSLIQQLAVALAEDHHPEQALAMLYDVLAKDLNAGDGEIKKCFTEIIAALGKGHSVGVQYQRKLYTLMY